ncbi:S41 family peptidase, partial [Flavobacterium psychrophilum]|uniref:S41 family peptidase n=1 Tax=Flavobacterium psychrophilum TaxID=96345 RepID=UPI000B064AD2
SNSYELEVIDPKTNKISVYTIRSVSEDWLEKQWNGIDELYFNKSKISSSLTFSNNNKTALLTYNTFKSDKYNNFKKITDDYFKKILQYKVTDLIIDLRNNGGGEEGFEDYVFSYLTNKPYKKYKYVQSTAFLYSFYTFTDRNTIEKQKSLENALQTEQQLESDGRILRKPNILIPEKTKTIHSKVICTF